MRSSQDLDGGGFADDLDGDGHPELWVGGAYGSAALGVEVYKGRAGGCVCAGPGTSSPLAALVGLLLLRRAPRGRRGRG